MILAASTQRNIGFVIATIVVIGFVLFVFFNLKDAHDEVGAEVELAPNRKPYLSDEELENTKLNRSLLFSLVMLASVAVGLPLYWLAEPGRMENASSGVLRKDATRGQVLFENNCQRCHNPGGAGGVAPFTLTDETEGKFVAQVQWTAPALTSVMSRFDETEVRYILNYGRNVMPAWGTIGGGPMTEQQITELVVYLRTIQNIGDEGQTKVQINGRTRRKLGPGAFFGEIALLDGGPRTASVIAETDVHTISIPHWNFRSLLKEQPPLALKMLEETCKRLRVENASLQG